MAQVKMITHNVAIIDHVGLKAGMECYDLGLCLGLKQKGCKVQVYSNFEPPGGMAGIFHSFRFRVNENIYSYFRLAFKYIRLRAEMYKGGTTNCILHGFRFGFPEWLLIRILKQPSVNLILIVHDPGSLIGHPASLKWKRKIFALCNRLVVHNDFSYGQLMKEWTPTEMEKLVAIPHGNFIDVTAINGPAEQEIRLPELKKNGRRLLFFGQIKATKGLGLLLEALAMTDPATELVIAGRMRKHSFSAYARLIRDLGIGNRVTLFVHYISPAMRNMLFQTADAVVLPYSKVYQSGVLLMAMSFGKAVIASDLPPNRELITDGENGFLFESGNIKELAKTIDAVMSNESLRRNVESSGFNFVKRQHNWDNIAEKWIRLFNS